MENIRNPQNFTKTIGQSHKKHDLYSETVKQPSSTSYLFKLAINMTAFLRCLLLANSVKVGRKFIFGPIFDEKNSYF